MLAGQSRARMARTAPLPTAPGVPLPPWLSRAKLGGGRRGWGGGGNTHKHPPSTLYPHPRVPGRRSNYPRSYSRGVREASRTRTPAPGQVQSGPCLRHRQLIGARRHRPSPWQRQGPVDADGGCYGNPGPMGTPANEIEAGVGGGGGERLSLPCGHHLALGGQGHLGCVPPQVHLWAPSGASTATHARMGPIFTATFLYLGCK